MARLPELFTRLHEVGSNGVQAPQLITGLGIPTQPAFSGLIQEKYKAWHKTRKVGGLAATAYQLHQLHAAGRREAAAETNTTTTTTNNNNNNNTS